jgi:hypothetical protein
MCQDKGFATGWEVIVAIRRFQHRLEVFMDQSLEPLGLSFAQYRALEVLASSNEMHVSELLRRFASRGRERSRPSRSLTEAVSSTSPAKPGGST